MPASEDHLSVTLAAVSRALADESDLTAVINRMCVLAVETIDACDHADIMIVTAGDVITAPASTDWVGTRVVSIEAEFDEGPCVDAARTGTTTFAPDLEHERRWPRFVQRALAETPVRGTMGLPLAVAGRTIGAIDVYTDEPNAFTEEDSAVAALFSAHAAVAFGAARERQEFTEALASRDVIGQAKGIIMAQSGVGADEAFDLLRRASQRLNEKIVVIAQRIADNPRKR